MKSRINNINIKLIFTVIALIFGIWPIKSGYSQGFNNNEWIFGYCGATEENSYLSFGKGQDPIVRTLPGSVIVGENNNAIAIDPITGNIIFYTNGELVYNGNNDPLEGMAPGINGNYSGRQQVSIGTLEFDPEGEKLYYIFYLSPTGQLQYSVVDMNAPGQAVGNQPPLGEVTDKDILITNGATGAITVIKTSSSPSYLVSFEGGNLISRRVENTQGDFTITDSSPIGITPKAMLFDEERGQIIILPENDGEDIVIIDYDTSNGTFGNTVSVDLSGGTESIDGAAFSPDGQYLYFSRGDELLRVPVNDLNADPELIPFENDVFNVYDIKVGPDGRLYYIYEEVDGGPQLIGRINNPNETLLADLDLEEDPFNGTDFCGTIFPQFAPNQDFSPTLDFIWEPDTPCSNNPVQLTSIITPENYSPVSFEWAFNPPLTDEEGNPVDIDFTQEHLLIPEEATANQSVDVTLTVTFADGTTQTVRKTIDLVENDLQANFSAQDTTVCEGACVDIGSLLEVQQGGGQGGETPGVGGGQGVNYEYFWSNYRDEGWSTRTDNCVEQPGLYWVLVREPGSECYAYAEVRVRIWDLPDQSNNIWYFGDGAGLDFNPDPDNPDGPLPRPVGHNRDIPAGTTTISDETGQVLFFTDGQSVWDLNGDLMENGDDIGGDNTASESVIAVPIPQNQTVFYVFTTQSSANGSNQVKYSVVDIKTENPTGVGSVVTKDNFLFSPSTEHSAALASGDTTWVMFHELGNNTFRAYPVSQFGIGQPVFSSVGSNHNFNTGVGSMKFSPDGSQLAITIQEGNCSRLEIFDFNQQTGRMTEYALLDLGCGDEIYGLEFSQDASRIFVSYSNGSGRIEEFLIKTPLEQREEDGPDPDLSCGSCFENASTRAARENCILSSSIRNNLTTAGPFGSLQIGPDGQIYVSRPGQGTITRIQPGANCDDSFYDEQGVNLEGGTMNLGLPAFVQQSGSSIPEPALAVPERLCLDPELGALGLLEGGGEPDIDSYFWTIVHEDGEEIISEFGGPGEEFQSLEQSFPRPGIYTVTLRVDRCGDPNYYEESLPIEIVAAPELTLPDEFTLCAGSPVELTAIDGYDPADGLYDFEWRNAAGQLIGDENSNTIEVTEESIYTVTVRFRLPDGVSPEEFDVCPATKSVFVGPAFDFDLTQSAEEVCYDESLVVFAPTTPILGEWFYQQVGSPDRVSLGEFFELELAPFTLPSPGEYEIFFLAEDPLVEDCFIEKRASLIVYPLPQVEIVILTDADDCTVPNGSFEITALTDIETLEISELGLSFGPLVAGEVLPVFADLEPGIYTIRMTTDFGCQFVQTAVIQNLNPPQGIEGYQVDSIPEICASLGIEFGQIIIRFLDGPVNGSYQIIREGDGSEFTGTIVGEETISVSVPAGFYSIIITDNNDCAIPFDGLIEVLEVLQVDFDMATDVVACGQYTFTPQSSEELIFTVIDANGDIILPETDGSFTILNQGVYTVRAEDPDGIDCPRERTLNVVFTDPPAFSLEGPRVDCDLGVFYEVILGPNVAPEDVFIFWLDQSGQIISRNPQFFPTAIGTYFVEVQPRNGTLCEIDPLQFVVDNLSEEIEVSLEVLPFCADDPFTIITVIADLSDITVIEWYSIQNGVRTPIDSFFGMDRVVIQQNGLYEVVLTNSSDCEVGSAQAEIIQSTIGPPVIEALYVICAEEGETPVIDPGEYDNYSWQINGEEVANTPTFSPVEGGEYTLIVGDDLGCFYEARFDVQVDCELKVIFPNAMILNDPSKNFVVYTSDFVDELEVYIYNRWGQLIFYCESMGNNADTPLCSWDGTVGGKFVPVGTYPVVVKYGSSAQSVRKSITKPILVLE
ncbi:gliding motility-associated C-terminal domain-containing protein [Shivajiella indica]|uniref:Gliding motility-associated C-terminal domain-containing protein n=1 Tax=Shivajiella indica TaxID=872115 RepID=A0ABW5B9M9_9BACT